MSNDYKVDNDTGIFNRYNTFSIYLPLLIYLVSIMCMVGALKGFVIYYVTSPIIIGIMFLNAYYEENNTIKNFIKISFLDCIGIILCWGIMMLIV